MSVTTTESCATHLCGTLFEFSLEAKDEISRSFKIIAGPNVSCDFNESNYFRIRCPKHDDTSLFIFSEILGKFIKAESEKELDMFEGSRLARISGTYANPLMDCSKETATQTVTDVGVSDEAVHLGEASSVNHDNDQPFNGSRSNNDVFLIEHETITRTWTPGYKGGFISLRSKDYALARIGALCNCRLVHNDSNPVDVIIKGDCEEDIQKVVSKLRVVDSAAYEMQSFPLIFSFPIMEGSLAPMLQMVALKDLKDNRAETTLLSPESPFAILRRTALIVSMIQAGERVPLKQSGVQQISKVESLWTKFPHQSFGVEAGISQESIEAAVSGADSASAENLASPTALWVQRAGQSQFLDPFEPDIQTQEPAIQEQLEAMAYRVPLEPTLTTVKPPTKRSRAARGASKAAITSALENTTPVVTEVVTLATTPTVVPTVSPVLAQTVISIGTRVEAQSRFATILEDTISRSPTTKQNQRPFDNLSAPLIESPHNAQSESVSAANLVISSRSVIQSKPVQSAEWQSKLVRGVKAGILIDVQEGPEDAISKRDLRRTMGQKKSKSGLNGSNTTMVRDFETAARQILDLALLCQGPISIEVGIGRLLVSPQGSSAEFKKPFAVAEWSSAFPTRNGVNGLARETIFTPRLTTHSPDADAILNIKLSRGQSLFIEDPCEREVTYIIFCITKVKERLVIEVSEDGSFMMKGSEFLVGALDWHFPLRSWDSRLQVTTQEPLVSNYQQQAQGIVRNMKVTVDMADRQSVNFSTTTIDQELMIQSVLLRRATAHVANKIYKDIVLHLEEVQDMSVKRISENEYHGSILKPAKMIAASKLWWEASLTSVKAAAIVKESEEVEYGEMGKWSPKRIIDEGIIKDLYALANEVVTRIDLVGSMNKSPGSNSDPKTSTKARTSPKTSIPEGPPGMVTYW